MAYDTPKPQTYSFVYPDMATADVTRVIKGPKGKRGKIVDLTFTGTTTTAGATATPHIQIGVAGDLGRFADLNVGAAVAPFVVVATAQPGSIKGLNGVKRTLDYDTDLVVTMARATGGGAAGAGHVHIAVDWF